MKCSFVDKKNDSDKIIPCEHIAELIPVLELRPDWTTPPVMCAIGKMGACASHHANIRLFDVLMNVDGEGIAAELERAGHKRPAPRFTTLSWKPIPENFTPASLVNPNTQQLINRPKLIKPKLVLPN